MLFNSGVFALFFVQSGLKQQIRHPHDAGQGGADLVIQAGQKGAF